MPSPTLRRKILKRLQLIALLYAGLVVLLVAGERSMVYQPLEGPSNPSDAKLANFHLRTLEQANQPPIIYWENTAPTDAPTVLYFHGNGGGLFMHKHALTFFNDAKLHVVAMEYPGYPGAEGKPSEALLVAQATALYDAVSKNTKNPPAIWGFSLGTGIAVQVAAARKPSALVLEAPFTAAVDRAQEMFFYMPIRPLMKNQYRSRDYIAKVTAPLFIMHGGSDGVIPARHGEALFAMANMPKTFKKYDGYRHNGLYQSGAYDDAVRFIRTYETGAD